MICNHILIYPKFFYSKFVIGSINASFNTALPAGTTTYAFANIQLHYLTTGHGEFMLSCLFLIKKGVFILVIHFHIASHTKRSNTKNY